jgi:uncharacterized protein
MAKREFEAKMIRIHLSESDRWHDKPLHEAILAKCLELGIAGATVYRGLEGFGASASVHHARSWPFSKDAPIMVSVIDTTSQVELLLPHLEAMVAEESWRSPMYMWFFIPPPLRRKSNRRRGYSERLSKRLPESLTVIMQRCRLKKKNSHAMGFA